MKTALFCLILNCRYGQAPPPGHWQVQQQQQQGHPAAPYAAPYSSHPTLETLHSRPGAFSGTLTLS